MYINHAIEVNNFANNPKKSVMNHFNGTTASEWEDAEDAGDYRDLAYFTC